MRATRGSVADNPPDDKLTPTQNGPFSPGGFGLLSDELIGVNRPQWIWSPVKIPQPPPHDLRNEKKCQTFCSLAHAASFHEIDAWRRV